MKRDKFLCTGKIVSQIFPSHDSRLTGCRYSNMLMATLNCRAPLFRLNTVDALTIPQSSFWTGPASQAGNVSTIGFSGAAHKSHTTDVTAGNTIIMNVSAGVNSRFTLTNIDYRLWMLTPIPELIAKEPHTLYRMTCFDRSRAKNSVAMIALISLLRVIYLSGFGKHWQGA